jgi:predicted nuclease of predicted toxin-antitoxin system
VKLLLDQDVYAATARFLRDSGHDLVTASEIGRSRASDSELLSLAHQQERVFVTRDRDFGSLAFLRNLGAGVIYMRISPSTLQAGHKELETVLTAYSEDELRGAFVVVQPGRHRFRKLPG